MGDWLVDTLLLALWGDILSAAIVAALFAAIVAVVVVTVRRTRR